MTMRENILAEVTSRSLRVPGRRPEPNDGLSTKAAPPPKGPPADELLAWARQRRREREQEER